MRLLIITIALALLAGACDTLDLGDDQREGAPPDVVPITLVPAPQRNPTTTDPTPNVPLGDLTVELIRSFDHDPDAWTQGLLIEQGRLFESTGDFEASESTLREIDPRNGEVLRELLVGEPYFSEGIELVGDRIFMLTWQDNTAFVYDRDTFTLEETFTYQGEGWGLCQDQDRLVMSDGSQTLTFRDPATFEVQGTLPVLHQGDDALRLNELECVDGYAYANVWLTNLIVRIDLATGSIVSSIDASSLKDDELDGAGNILNGIAYDEASGTFLLTGKFWPTVFEVEFVAK